MFVLICYWVNYSRWLTFMFIALCNFNHWFLHVSKYLIIFSTFNTFCVTFRSHCQRHFCQRSPGVTIHVSVHHDKGCRRSILRCIETWNEEIWCNGVDYRARTFWRSDRKLECMWLKPLQLVHLNLCLPLGVLEHSSSCCCSNPNEWTLLLCISVYAVSVMMCWRMLLIYTKQLPVGSESMMLRRWCKL